MKIIKIIMATSADKLKNELKELGDYIRSLNDQYYNKGIYFRLENLLEIGTEEEQKQEVCSSEFFYIVFSNEADDSIVKKFDIALQNFKEKDNPRIYTYFQKLPDGVGAADSVRNYMERLDKEIGHYYSLFQHLDSIKLNMLLELTRTQVLNSKVEIRDGKALVNGKEILSLENVPLFRNNEEFHNLIKERDELKVKRIEFLNLCNASPDDMEADQKLTNCMNRLKEISEQLHQMEKVILSVCMDVTEIVSSGKPLSWREKEACKCFDIGDYKGALAILSDPNLEIELEQAKEINALTINRFNEYIRVKRLNIKGLKALGVNTHTLSSIYDCYEKAVQVAEEFSVETDIVYEYACFLYEQKKFKKALEKAEWLQRNYQKRDNIELIQQGRLYNLLGILYGKTCITNGYAKEEEALQKAKAIFEKLGEEAFELYGDGLASVYNNLGILYQEKDMLPEAEEAYRKANDIYKRLANQNPEVYESYLAQTYNNLGCFLTKFEDYKKAEKVIKKAITIWEKLRKKYPEEAVDGLAGCYINLGNLYYEMGQTANAEESYIQANGLYKELVNDNPAYISNLADSFHNLAVILQKKQNYEESKMTYEKAIDCYEKIDKEDRLTFTKSKNSSYNNYIDLLSEINKDKGIFLNNLTEEEKELAVLGMLLKFTNYQYDGPEEKKQKALQMFMELDKSEWLRAISLIIDILSRQE